MANSNIPFGFQPLVTNGKQDQVTVYAKTAVALYAGDVVKMTSTGQVAVAAAGDVFIGVCAESATAGATTIAVYDDPSYRFMAQVNGDFQLTDVGQNANIVATAADTTLSRSKHSIDSSSFATTASLQFKVMGLVARGVNAVGSYAIVNVKPNAHFFASGVAGI